MPAPQQAIGGRFVEAGHEVLLTAGGAHFEALSAAHGDPEEPITRTPVLLFRPYLLEGVPDLFESRGELHLYLDNVCSGNSSSPFRLRVSRRASGEVRTEPTRRCRIE